MKTSNSGALPCSQLAIFTGLSAVMAALRELHPSQVHVPRRCVVSMEEAIDRMQKVWIDQDEASGVPIHVILAGRMWIGRYADSSQLEILFHQIDLFMDKERENWTKHKHRYQRIEKLFARSLFNAILSIRKNIVSRLCNILQTDVMF